MGLLDPDSVPWKTGGKGGEELIGPKGGCLGIAWTSVGDGGWVDGVVELVVEGRERDEQPSDDRWLGGEPDEAED